MTLAWQTAAAESISLEEVCDYFNSLGQKSFEFDFDKSAEILGRLYNNRNFLVDHFVDVLKKSTLKLNVVNRYSAQVFVLRQFKYFTVRSVIWDHIRGLPGEELFLYDKPHDHDFSFFTLGYFGPGYRTRVYSYDYDSVIGYPGETVEISPSEEWELNERKVVLYRGNVDVHNQSPPKSLSISVNILENPARRETRRRQYEFDQDVSSIRRVVNGRSHWVIAAAGALLGGDAAEMVKEMAQNSSDEHARFRCVEALARIRGLSYLEYGLRDRSAYVRANCKALETELAQHVVPSTGAVA